MSEGPLTGEDEVPAAEEGIGDSESPGTFLGPQHVMPALDNGELLASTGGARGGWLAVIRPRMLFFALVPALVAVVLVLLHGSQLSPVVGVSALVSVLLIQAGASLLDTYLEHARYVQHAPDTWEDDDESGLHTLLIRSGVHPLGVLRASMLLLALGAVAGIPLVIAGGAFVAFLGVAGLLATFIYSSTTYAFKRTPLGDLLILLALGPGIVATILLAAHRVPSPGDLGLAVALGFFALAPVEALHLRDLEHDRTYRRRTLATLLGARRARALYGVCILAGCVFLLLAALPAGQPHGALLALLALPSAAIPLTGSWVAGPVLARTPVVAQAVRAYIVTGVWLLLGLILNLIFLLVSALLPV
jgi:1,4-dihydroxy-2-naphthoate octaprenyltransferase